jgi:hypothetical protein
LQHDTGSGRPTRRLKYAGVALIPPSTTRFWPLIHVASGDARKQAGIGDVARTSESWKRDACQPAADAVRPVVVNPGALA